MTEKNYDDIINYDWNRDSLKDRMPLSQRARSWPRWKREMNKRRKKISPGDIL